MTKASDNIFPRFLVSEGGSTATPAAAQVTVYAKADGLLYSKDDAGVETLLSSGPAGSVATDTIWDTKGDLAAATGADAAAKLAAAANGSFLRTASGQSTGLEWQLNNLAAAVAPAVTDDSGDGYSVGSRWIDTTADKEYVCLDATVGAAVWTETTASGGGATHSYLGYNTVGASFENVTVNRQYMKKITVASAGTLLSVDVHIKATVTDPTALIGIVLDDASALPTLMRGQSYTHQIGLKGGNAARWFSLPIGAYLTAGDYWIGVTVTLVGASVLQLAYDTGGSDRYSTVGPYGLDGDYGATTDSTLKYSIRGSFLT